MEVVGVVLSETSQETRQLRILAHEETKEKREPHLKAQQWFPGMLKSAHQVKTGKERSVWVCQMHTTHVCEYHMNRTNRYS